MESTAPDGTTSQAQSYQRRLGGLAPGTHVFRLVQLAPDGTPRTLPERAEATVEIETHNLSATGPNPFHVQTRFALTVETAQHVTAVVYDALGRRVKTIHDGPVSANTPLDLTFGRGRYASGTYFVRITGETFADTRSVVLVK